MANITQSMISSPSSFVLFSHSIAYCFRAVIRLFLLSPFSLDVSVNHNLSFVHMIILLYISVNHNLSFVHMIILLYISKWQGLDTVRL